jgi:hypothetical protein
MPPPLAFAAFDHLMSPSKHVQGALVFREKPLAAVCRIWDAVLKKKMPKPHARLKKLKIGVNEYAVEWFQTGFLAVPWAPALQRRLLDRFVSDGLRALITCGIWVIDLCQKKLETAAKDDALALLRNPALEPAFADWRAALGRLDAVRVSTKEFDDAGGRDLGKGES